ncbi:MAG: prepilin-type N-terminal cleavage/methylation domain-containing protein [Myxococcota bacterium]|nr:prepilin-type N-terminal cleavage/methylation domain-containing protein [Myxococcota bacterium]
MRRHRRQGRARAGYTLIEVMMAVAVMTAGAVGIMALHQATMRGNLDARQVATATHLASTWVERLQRDATGWSQAARPGTTVVPPLMLANTRYLNLVPALGAAPTWLVPGPSTATESASFDHWGRDTVIAGQMEYCTNVRLQWVYVGQAMRADVRVWWARHNPSVVGGAGLANCGAGLDPNTLTNRLRDVRFVYASTVIRWVPAPAGAAAGGP